MHTYLGLVWEVLRMHLRQTEEERERKEREEVERAVKKRNTDSDIKSARERYLERKRRKLEGGEAESEKNSSETTS